MRFNVMNSVRAAATGAAVLSISSGAFAQTLLTGFNFGSTAGTPLLTSTSGLFASTITTNFAGTDVTSFAGSTINAQNGDAAGQALALVNQTENGNYIQLGVSTVGFNTINLNFATQRTATGFGPTTAPNQVYYSTTGTGGAFTLLTTYSPPTAFALQTLDFSTITGLNNNVNAAFRIVFNGNTSAAGNNRIDNLTVTGNAITGAAAPEPGTLALLGTCAVPGMGLLAARRRRANKTA